MYFWLPTVPVCVARMDSNEEHSLWRYSPSVWPDSNLLEEEPLLAGLSVPNLCSTGSTITQGNVLQGELDAILVDDVLKYWDGLEQSENNKEDGEKSSPLVPYSEKGAASNKKRADRVRSNDKVLTFEIVSQYFYRPIKEAARELNVGLTALKKKCRELGIPRWPRHKIKSLQTLINNVEVLQKAAKAKDDEELSSTVEMLEQERMLLEQKPYVDLEEKTKRLRQACFKISYNKKQLLAPEAGESPKYT